MFLLLRMTFWLGVVCVLLPGTAKSPDAQIDAASAITLASAAVSDARGFCERQPGACVAGTKVAVSIGQKAEAGARTLFDAIVAKFGEAAAPATPPAGQMEAAIIGVDKGTLTANDLAPAWHAPVPLPRRREALAARPAA
jgi:hypothetical protein